MDSGMPVGVGEEENLSRARRMASESSFAGVFPLSGDL